MSSITLSATATINVVSTTSDYSQKSNLGTAATGSYLIQAIQLVYDDILRYQTSKDGYFTDAEVADFKYHAFEGNALWFMDELVGIESDWKKDASNTETTAYGYGQFTEASVPTAVNRYVGHLERFNARRIYWLNKESRGWTPYGIAPDKKVEKPDWLKTLSNAIQGNLIGTYYVPYYDHKKHLGDLTYDQYCALVFVHLHSKTSKDSNFRLLSFGDVDTAKTIYKNNHHTNPDAATLKRLDSFFKIHYKPAQQLAFGG
tara:strand:- start:867 stop:1643 length:777 start_codon:yes stop_codon:yes gene_type:complete